MGIFVGVALVVYGGVWYFITSGMHAEVVELESQVASLTQQNAAAQIDSQRLTNFKATYTMKQQEYDELKALLPEQRELTTVLQGVQDRARSTRLVLRSFSPKEDFQQDFYNGKKINVGVTSSFSSLREFFELMAQYQRIVSITNVAITQLDKQSPGKTIEAKFDLTAYYVSAESLQKSAKPSAPGQGPAADKTAAPAGGAAPAAAPAAAK
jgi:Tfp pilus assembly protein PilO